MTTQLELHTLFHLAEASKVEVGSIQVKVDNAPVSANYDTLSNNIQIAAKDAGQAASLIEITACISNDGSNP